MTTFLINYLWSNNKDFALYFPGSKIFIQLKSNLDLYSFQHATWLLFVLTAHVTSHLLSLGCRHPPALLAHSILPFTQPLSCFRSRYKARSRAGRTLYAVRCRWPPSWRRSPPSCRAWETWVCPAVESPRPSPDTRSAPTVCQPPVTCQPPHSSPVTCPPPRSSTRPHSSSTCPSTASQWRPSSTTLRSVLKDCKGLRRYKQQIR